MRITVRTAGLLGEYLPPGSTRNRAELDVTDAVTPRDVIVLLGMPENDRYLVSLNGELVTEKRRTEVILADGDELSIMPPLKGG